MEAVKLRTYDGVQLAASLYLPEPGTDWAEGIIVCHGLGSRKENYADFGVRASEAGFAVLAIDLRGHGKSGGRLDGNVFNDVAAALSYLQSRPEVNPMSIAIRGSSMGGWLAVHTAAHLVDLTAVVAYCPPTESLLNITVEEIAMVQRGHASTVVSGDIPRVDVDSLMRLLYRLDIRKAARRINPRPLLLVHCEGDKVVPSHTSQTIYAAAEEPKAFWLLEGGDHRFAQHDPDTDMRMLEWLSMVRSGRR